MAAAKEKHPHVQLIENFYNAFQKLDGTGMAACYHPNIRFTDPGFGDLEGKRAGGMWLMLTSQAKNFELTFSGVEANEQRGKAYWEAKYDFTLTKRRVHNKIQAEFEFKDGKIIRHIDTFDAYAWSKMAFGPIGFVVGWTPFFQSFLKKQTNAMLDKFMAKRGL